VLDKRRTPLYPVAAVVVVYFAASNLGFVNVPAHDPICRTSFRLVNERLFKARDVLACLLDAKLDRL
jgi:hypothetical protein